MKFLEGHEAYQFREKGNDGVIYASATVKGIQLYPKGYVKTDNDYLLFGLDVSEARELGGISGELSSLVPSIEDAVAEHDREQQERAANFARENPGADPLPYKGLMARSPVVHVLSVEDDKKARFLGVSGGSLERPSKDEDLEVLGGLTWAIDQLIFRYEKVDTLLFRPEVFTAIGEIAGHQPDFSKQSSVWDKVRH